ncbi:hypothetical protein GQ602_005577 [Ophiocordyceps camponoti-floridani]|uniref:Uncharacterized protein n=1 Tax=Ophiocordyceps camponoti-floridani TaxID=2030778 RepID=A0A8H4Q3Q2_9HYPO|nr:hypothetical protein GQ602_005577 [Ophiocordyceps camponoti-floridani]
MEPQLSYIGEHVATCTNLFDISKEQSVCGIMAKVGFKTALGYTMFDTAAEDVSSSTRWLRRRLCWSCVGTGRDLPMCRLQVSGFPRKLQQVYDVEFIRSVAKHQSTCATRSGMVHGSKA